MSTVEFSVEEVCTVDCSIIGCRIVDFNTVECRTYSRVLYPVVQICSICGEKMLKVIFSRDHPSSWITIYHSAESSCTLQCQAVHCIVLQCSVVQCIELCSSALQWCSVQCSVEQSRAVQCSALHSNTVQFRIL